MNTALSRTWFGMQIHTVSQFPVLRGSHNQKTDKDPILTVASGTMLVVKKPGTLLMIFCHLGFG
jgi:dTDP-4-dehydrorhamnose 3,5-epimerase-like enzyme